jgi:uncharacterized protein YndB with AHSA1/START domain
MVEYQQRRPGAALVSSFLWDNVIFGRQWTGRTGQKMLPARVVARAHFTMEARMPYAYTLTSVIPATPGEIYEAWLDSLSHTEMTGGEASMSGEVGAEVSAWDGYISGRNLELVPGERIVQSWRTSQFADDHEDSIVTVTLENAGGGTRLTLVHSNVPDDQRSYEAGGWESNYFEPMRVYFAKLAQESGEEQPEPAPSKVAAKPRRAAGKKVRTGKTAATPKRAGKAKSAKKAAPPARPSPTKKKGKRVAATKAKPARQAKKRKTAKRAARKAVRRPRAHR